MIWCLCACVWFCGCKSTGTKVTVTCGFGGAYVTMGTQVEGLCVLLGVHMRLAVHVWLGMHMRVEDTN